MGFMVLGVCLSLPLLYFCSIIPMVLNILMCSHFEHSNIHILMRASTDQTHKCGEDIPCPPFYVLSEKIFSFCSRWSIWSIIYLVRKDKVMHVVVL